MSKQLNLCTRNLLVPLALFSALGCGGGGGDDGGGGSITPEAAATKKVSGRVDFKGKTTPSTSALAKKEHYHAPVRIHAGEAIVTLEQARRGDGAAAIQEVVSAFPALGIEVVRASSDAGPFLLSMSAGNEESTRAALADLVAHPAIAAADANRTMSLTRQSVDAGGDDDEREPSDPMYGKQWHYEMISLPEAWAITTGSKDISVAVIDSAFDLNHPDLKSKFLSGLDLKEGKVGTDVAAKESDDKDPTTDHHGTHVAGTIGAEANNKEGGSGVAWGCKIVPIQVFNKDGGPSLFEVCDAIKWALGEEIQDRDGTAIPKNENEVRVINLSLGIGPTAPSCEVLATDDVDACLQEVLDLAESKGVVVVAAAGNDGDTCTALPEQVSFPAGQGDTVLSVASVGPFATRAAYSNKSAKNFIAAPGGEVKSEGGGILSTVAPSQYGQATWEGTSMAAPHVSGVVALMLSANPDLTPKDVRTILSKTALDLNDTEGRDSEMGFGLIQAARAVKAAKEKKIDDADKVFGEDDIATVPNPLAFGLSDRAASILVLNPGGGSISIEGTPTFTQNKGDKAWASVSVSGDKLTVTPDRAGLTPGLYKGRISFQAKAGDEDVEENVVPVTMTVLEGTPDIGDVEVRLVDAEGETVGDPVTAKADDGYEFDFDVELPTGDEALYRVVVESPDDSVDEYEGVFPAPSDPTDLRLGRDSGDVELEGSGILVVKEGSLTEERGSSGDEVGEDGRVYTAVYDANTGDPIPGVKLTIDGSSTDATTDFFGEASFKDVTAPFTVTASAEGYSAMTFMGINSDHIEFELEEVGVEFFENNLTLTVTSPLLGEGTDADIAIVVDGELEDIRAMENGKPEEFEIEGGQPFSISLIFENENEQVDRFEVFDVDELYGDESFEIPIPDDVNSANVIYESSKFPTAPEGTSDFLALAMAFGEDDTELLLGFDDGDAGESIVLSRAKIDNDEEELIAAQLVLFAYDDGEEDDDDDGDEMGMMPAPPMITNGSDDCSMPAVIAGQGDFPYDTTDATTGTEGQTTPDCADGAAGVPKDLWYDWTADVTGKATITTDVLGATNVNADTKMAVYDGAGCPAGSPLVCNEDIADDPPNFRSAVTFDVVKDKVYAIQLGQSAFPGGMPPSGMFNISIVGEPDDGGMDDPGMEESKPEPGFSAAFRYGTLAELGGGPAEMLTEESGEEGELGFQPATFSRLTFPDLKLRELPKMTAPEHNADGVGLAPTLTFTLDETTEKADLVHIEVFGEEDFYWEFFAPGDTTSVTLPALPEAGLKKGTTYAWLVSDYVFESGFDFDEFSADFSDVAIKETQSELRLFKTAD